MASGSSHVQRASSAPEYVLGCYWYSPRVPDVDEVSGLLRTAVSAGWIRVNPDCGLKTRGYAEVEPALQNLVAAANTLRSELA
ncbi:hypothetical protein [Amycolatopsis sp. cmx-11-32]|uniref:hypothetical protein n=1 Tax=Amycolatopsis sp. cmx-11-32 TaxID=2785796 RepID=UPI0039E27B0B